MFRKKLTKSSSTSALTERRTSKLNLASSKELSQIKYEGVKLTPLSRNDFDHNNLNNWSVLRTFSAPKRRSFHSSLIYKDYLYIFGGKDITEGKLNDIQKINLKIDKPKWINVIPSNNIFLDSLAFHTGNEVNGLYYIIGGQNRSMLPSNTVFIYNINENILEKKEFNENEFSGVCMHSANYYPKKKSIVIFGGFKSESLNNMYFYNIQTNKFKQIKYKSYTEEKEIKISEMNQLVNLSNEDEKKGINNTIENIISNEKKNETENEIENEIESETENEIMISDKTNIPIARTSHSSCILNKYLYIFGGVKKDGNFLNDLWQFDLERYMWLKISKKEDLESANWPQPRCGQSLVLINNSAYIFGGKIGNVSESNDLWKYNFNDNKFTLIHDIMLEQYSKTEIEEMNKEFNDITEYKKKFHLITRKELEDRKNPFSRIYQERRTSAPKKRLLNLPHDKNKKNKYEAEIFANTGFHQMKHSDIYCLDDKGVKQAINHLNMILPFKLGQKGDQVPLPRDGQSMDLFENNKLVVFGGDRNKYPFNDLFIYNIC